MASSSITFNFSKSLLEETSVNESCYQTGSNLIIRTCCVCCVSTSVTLRLQCWAQVGSPWLWSPAKNKKRGRTSTVWATDRLNERRTEENTERLGISRCTYIQGELWSHGASRTVSVPNYRNLHVILHSLNCSIELLFFFLFLPCGNTLRSRGEKQKPIWDIIYRLAFLFLVTGTLGRTLIASRWDTWEDWEKERHRGRAKWRQVTLFFMLRQIKLIVLSEFGHQY